MMKLEAFVSTQRRAERIRMGRIVESCICTIIGRLIADGAGRTMTAHEWAKQLDELDWMIRVAVKPESKGAKA
jgi:hypothetical protein